jgi:hypothetical protein
MTSRWRCWRRVRTGILVWLATLVGGCLILYMAVAPQMMAESRNQELPDASLIVDGTEGQGLWVFVPLLMLVATLLAFTTTRPDRRCEAREVRR